MAVIKAVSSRAGITHAINYVMKTEKTEQRLLSGYNCSPETVSEEMLATKQLYKKMNGRTYKHFIQSFAPGEKITTDTAHEIAMKFIQSCHLFQGYEVLVATHKDRKHIHTHFIVNSVNFENGKKFQMSANDLQDMKNLSDELCKKYGLTICTEGKTFEGLEMEETTSYKKEKYQFLKMAEMGMAKSYVQQTALAVLECMEDANNKEEFIEQMKERGYQTDWREKRKYITFTDPDGNKVRDKNIAKTYHLKIGKEELQDVFKENVRRRDAEKRAREQLARTDKPAVMQDSGIGEHVKRTELECVGCKTEVPGNSAETKYRARDKSSGTGSVSKTASDIERRKRAAAQRKSEAEQREQCSKQEVKSGKQRTERTDGKEPSEKRTVHKGFGR